MTMGKREKTRMIEKRERKKILRFIADILLIILPPALCFYLLECYSHNPFAEVRPWAQFFNILLFELCSGICFCLTGRLKWAYRILFSGAMIYGIANTYVVRFRTNPIVPWDILSIKTAASVAGNYDFTPDVRMVVVTLAFALLIFLSRFCSVTITRRPIWPCTAERRFSEQSQIVQQIIYAGVYDGCGRHGGDFCHEFGVYVH